MAHKWKKLEQKCYEHLETKYGKNNSIKACGKSNATESDIKFKPKYREEFFIEVKDKSAQGYQFVLFPDKETKKFIFVKRKNSPKSDYRQIIIDYMDEKYETFYKVGQNGIPINIDSSILYGLVEEFSSAKNVKFFMTIGTNIIIFPLDKFSTYFDIEAYYRRKKSGSQNPSKKNNHEEIISGLSEYKISGSIEYIAKRCFIHSTEDIHGKKIICDHYTYMFVTNEHSKAISKNNDKMSFFEVRRLANTNNPNVICKLTLKQIKQDEKDLQNFEDFII